MTPSEAYFVASVAILALSVAFFEYGRRSLASSIEKLNDAADFYESAIALMDGDEK